MGFLSSLFGGSKAKKHLKGSRENPWVCEPPPNLDEMRKIAFEAFGTLGVNAPGGASPKPKDMDGMIAEQMKMGLLSSLFGKEGKAWKAGERRYLPNSIQTQEIVFLDGSPTITFYTDFSKFGSF